MATEYKLPYTGIEINEKIGKIDDLVEAEKRLTNEIAVERARINQLTTLPEGSTTGDAELIDIRTGADGVVYSSAGEAVRGQIGDISDIIMSEIHFLNGVFINNSGGVINNSVWSATDYIPVKEVPITPTIFYNVKTVSNALIVLFDNRKNAISTIPITANSDLEVCKGVLTEKDFGDAYYIRLSSFTDYTSKKVAVCTPTIKNEGITEEYIAPGAITEEKLAVGSVAIDKIGFLTHLDGTNLIDKTKFTAGRYIDAQGQIAGAGNSGVTNFRVTDYIKLEKGIDYYHEWLFGGYYAFYDAEYNVVESVGNVAYNLKNPFRIPDGAVYGRFTILSVANAEKAWIHTDSIKPREYGYALKGVGTDTGSKPTEFNGDDICVFSKGICIGDSLTQGTMNYIVNDGTNKYVNIAKYSYPTILSKLTGIPFDNKGLGGKTSDEWYEAESGSDLSGYDIAIIQLGVNDAIRYSGWTNASVTGFTNIINKLKAENQNIKIFVATIMPALSYNGTAIDAVSQGIREFVDSLNDDDVILLDMALYAHTGESEGFNCGHLSAYGYWRIAKDYKAYISWYMSNHKKQFREVQFIGTDYVYSANR